MDINISEEIANKEAIINHLQLMIEENYREIEAKNDVEGRTRLLAHLKQFKKEEEENLEKLRNENISE